MQQANAQSLGKPKMSRAKKISYAALALLAVLAVVLTIVYRQLTYSPLPEAKTAMESDSTVSVRSMNGGYVFEPASGNAKQPNIIFYPGGLVKPESYALYARGLAETGHRVFLAVMPLNLAIFGSDRADGFIGSHPGETFVIGGHSLGGVFASRYAVKHQDSINGVYFMASYADQGGSLKDLSLSALQITATQDAVLNQEKWEEAKANLPANTTFVSIQGGNHGQFGLYGKQKGDNDPTITPAQQLEQVIAAMTDWLAKLQ